MKKLVAAAALLLPLPACETQYEWSKPGVEQAQYEGDLAYCRRLARNQAQREAFGRTDILQAPVYDVDTVRGTVREQFRSERKATTLTEASRREELFEGCMTKLGYRLVETS